MLVVGGGGLEGRVTRLRLELVGQNVNSDKTQKVQQVQILCGTVDPLIWQAERQDDMQQGGKGRTKFSQHNLSL